MEETWLKMGKWRLHLLYSKYSRHSANSRDNWRLHWGHPATPNTNTWHTLPHSSQPSPGSSCCWSFCSPPIPTLWWPFLWIINHVCLLDCNYPLTYLVPIYTMWFWEAGPLPCTLVFTAPNPESHTLLTENFMKRQCRCESWEWAKNNNDNTERAIFKSVCWSGWQ